LCDIYLKEKISLRRRKMNKKSIPVKEGLWYETTSGSKLHLIGHKCAGCGELFFPRKENGICTHCYSTNLKEIPLSSRGTVYSHTVVTMRPPGGYYRGEVPYAIGFVELPEGIRVETLFTDCDPEEIAVGAEVELVIEKLHEDEEGNDVIAYKFRPVTP
jgi:uncharacterized OB-fold protein